MNSQELREKIARWLQKNTDFACNLEWDAFDEDAQEGFRCKADEIMSLLSEHYAKTLRAVGELYQQLLEFAEHGDYSNGNEAIGMDEGRVRASEWLQRFRKVAEALKRGEWLGKEIRMRLLDDLEREIFYNGWSWNIEGLLKRQESHTLKAVGELIWAKGDNGGDPDYLVLPVKVVKAFLRGEWPGGE